jgi:hypothetical protein
VITIDFITKLPRTTRKHDSIMVVVDKLTKDSHFVPVKTTHTSTNIAEIYMKEIARLHGIPRKIVSDKDAKFTSNFWRGLFKGFGTNLKFSTTYHLLSHIVVKGSMLPKFVAYARSMKAQHSEWSNMDSNQASEQVQFSMAGIPCEVQISGPRVIWIIKLHKV